VRVSELSISNKSLISIVFISTTFFLVYFLSSVSHRSSLRVSLLDVGQGDSILIQTINGGNILIDGGRDRTVLTRLGEELNFLDRKIDLVIATHDDGDHIAGLIDVLRYYNVRALIYSLPNSDSEISKELLQVAKQKNIRMLHARNEMVVSSSDGLIFKILFPVSDMSGGESNEASVVTQFIFGNNIFLFTGDLGIAGEVFLTQRYGASLKSDVLKLGHHGSDTSTHPLFLQKVLPEAVVVSAGIENSFGHPHKSEIDLVKKFGANILDTSKQGTVTFLSNGKNIWIE
jgi:competence protein ComEC